MKKPKHFNDALGYVYTYMYIYIYIRSGKRFTFGPSIPCLLVHPYPPKDLGGDVACVIWSLDDLHMAPMQQPTALMKLK